VLSESEEKQAQIIFNLLKEATSQNVVRDFLKEKNIPITAPNWDTLYSERILPALRQKKLELDDLASLLREVEEQGRQHTFIFKCPPADAAIILNKNRIQKIAAELGVSKLLSEPQYVEMPEEARLVDIRLAEAPNGTGPISLTIKICECRETNKLVGEEYDEATSRKTKTYEVKKRRAVSIAHLNSEGVLELRIASRDNSSKYHEQISAVLRLTSKLIPMDSFEQLSLSKAKGRLFSDKDKLVGVVRYTTTTAKNDFGVAMNLSAADMSKNLHDDGGSTSAMNEFLSNNGFVTGSNVWFIMPNDAERQIHVMLSGELNEFAINAACTPREYSYVIGKILSLN